MNAKIIITIALVGILVVIGVISFSFSSYQSASSPTLEPILADQEYPYTPPLDLEGYTPPTGPPPSDDEWEEWENNQATTTVPNGDGSDILTKLRTIFAQIEAETQLTASNPTQCKLLPLGHSPCGGPGFYHIYSSVGSNESRLLELAIEHRTLAQQYNQANESVGICVITPEPEIEIVNGKCSDDF